MQENVPENASDVARELRVLAQGLKEAFKKNDVLNRDVEFKRKSLRKQQLKLLLLFPTAKEAKEVETHIWMQTSYHFIAAYKQRIAVLDRKIFAPQNARDGERRERDPSGGGHVEYRKLLMRFRQFLAEEERFYTQLLVRFRSQFALGEAARLALVRAEILQAPAVSPTSPGTSDGADDADALREGVLPRAEAERNLFPEPRDMPPRSEKEREVRLTVFTKLLVCLGDIARYREQYNDGGGRPRAGHEEGAPRRGRRGGRGSNNGAQASARPRDYRRAQTIYEQARLLLPDDGNASHQLAILAAYKNSTFLALLHYYRALCVRQPYDTASDNLNVVLKKALDQYKAAKNAGKDKNEEALKVQKLRLDRFREWVVVLHGLWYLDSDSSSTKALKQSRLILDEYRTLLADRILPISTVSDVFILAVAALWKLRMIRDKKIRADPSTIIPHVATHVLGIAYTLLAMGTAQLAEARGEDVRNVHGDTLSDDLAQRITAIFRRTVPALRIMSKWLRTNIGYLHAEATRTSSSSPFAQALKEFWATYAEFSSALADVFPIARLPALRGPLEEDVEIAGFSPIKRGLVHGPAATVGGLAPGLEGVHPNEVYLMRIHDLLDDAKEVAVDEKSPIVFENGRYIIVGVQGSAPNVEPKGIDVEQAASMPSNPHVNGDARNAAGVEGSGTRVGHGSPQPAASDGEDEDDDSMTQATRTDDDVIREAFDTALDAGGDDADGGEDDDDQIIWSPSTDYNVLHQTPIVEDQTRKFQQQQHPFPSMEVRTHAAPASNTHLGQISPTTSQQMHPNHHIPIANNPADTSLSPHRQTTFMHPRVPSTSLGGKTAEDLLNNVLGLGFSARPRANSRNDFGAGMNTSASARHVSLGAGADAGAAAPATSTAPQAPMLFGAGSPNMASKSIWSNTNGDGGAGVTAHFSGPVGVGAAAPARVASMPMHSAAAANTNIGTGTGVGIGIGVGVPNPSLAPGHGRSLSGSWSAAALASPGGSTKQRSFTPGAFGAIGQQSQPQHLHAQYPLQHHHHQQQQQQQQPITQNALLGYGQHMHPQAPLQQSASMPLPLSGLASLQKGASPPSQIVYDSRLSLGNGSANGFGPVLPQAQVVDFGVNLNHGGGPGPGLQVQSAIGTSMHSLGFNGSAGSLYLKESDARNYQSQNQVNVYYDARSGNGLTSGHGPGLNGLSANANGGPDGLGGVASSAFAHAHAHPGPVAYRRSIWET